MQNLRFQCVALQPGANIQVSQQANGYYRLPVSAINATSASTKEYFEPESVKKIFDENGMFKRRVRQGVMYGEYDHPKRKPEESREDFTRRCMFINSDRIACHFNDVWLEPSDANDPSAPILQMAEVMPFGPYKDICHDSITTPSINTAFSVRAMVDRAWVGSVLMAYTRAVITYDLVPEGGLSIASKFNSPDVRKANPNLSLQSLYTQKMSKEELMQSLSQIDESQMTMQSGGMILDELKSIFGTGERIKTSHFISKNW